MNTKKLFFGLEICATWPDTFPQGRIIAEPFRHITLAFLGYVDFDLLSALLSSMPVPPWKIGRVGILDSCMFLPERYPRVVAYHLKEFDSVLISYHDTLNAWLAANNFATAKRNFLPHVTISRGHFIPKQWREAYQPMPCTLTNFNLYEGLGNSNYKVVWQHQILPPFKEIEHAGDLAFHVSAETLPQLHLHAQIALAFKYPELLPFLQPNKLATTLTEIIFDLNDLISTADQHIGSPCKAVSLHGDIIHYENNTIAWDMIIDI